MRYSNRLNNQSSERKSKQFIHKTQSLPPDFGHQPNEEIMRIASEPQLRLNTQQLMTIELFVEEVSSNPYSLLELVDYKELIESMKEESELIRKKVQQMKAEAELKRREENQERKRQQQDIKRMKIQESDTEKEIKKYLSLMETEREERKEKKSKKMNIRKKLSEEIDRIAEATKIQLQKINSQINSCRLNSQNIMQQIEQVQSKIGNAKQQISLHNYRKNQVSEVQRKLTVKRTEMVIIKTQEIQAIKNYKKLATEQKSEESVLKTNKQKKLTKITEELERALQKLDRSQLNNMILKSDQNRASLATAADQNQQFQDEQSELQRIQKQNPALKDFFCFNLKILPVEYRIPDRRTQDDGGFELKQQKIIEQLKRIQKEESELDGFNKMLKNKLETINQQINQVKKPNIFK